MTVTGSPWRDRQLRLVGQRADGTQVWRRAAFHDRPPVGPALAGRRSAASGRGHRASHTAAARSRRTALALQAFELRCAGQSIRAIADAVGVSRTLVGRWLVGVWPGGAEEVGPTYLVPPREQRAPAAERRPTVSTDPSHRWPSSDQILASRRDPAAAQAAAGRAAIFGRGGATSLPTADEARQAEAKRAEMAWQTALARTAGWPTELRDAELAAVQATYGPRPGTRPAGEQVLERIPRLAEEEPAPEGGLATQRLLNKLVADNRRIAGN